MTEPAALHAEITKLETIGIEQLAEIQRLTAELSRGREENIKLLNDASIWRNRAIGAEEELREGGRGIDLRRGFER